MKAALEVINRMQEEGVIGEYAIGGAVGATFYLEPFATLDVDVFLALKAPQGSVLLTLAPLYKYLASRGYPAEKEHVLIEGWPVQFLPPEGALGEEAVQQAVVTEVEGVRTRVISAEHLVAMALRTGRAKDFSRILQFVESGVLDRGKLASILQRHELQEKWKRFGDTFLKGTS